MDPGEYLVKVNFRGFLESKFEFTAEKRGIFYSNTEIYFSLYDFTSQDIDHLIVGQTLNFYFRFFDAYDNQVLKAQNNQSIEIVVDSIKSDQYTSYVFYDSRYDIYSASISFKVAGIFTPKFFFNKNIVDLTLLNGYLVTF
jgi:hypothetical protein